MHSPRRTPGVRRSGSSCWARQPAAQRINVRKAVPSGPARNASKDLEARARCGVLRAGSRVPVPGLLGARSQSPRWQRESGSGHPGPVPGHIIHGSCQPVCREMTTGAASIAPAKTIFPVFHPPITRRVGVLSMICMECLARPDLQCAVDARIDPSASMPHSGQQDHCAPAFAAHLVNTDDVRGISACGSEARPRRVARRPRPRPSGSGQ